MSASEQRTTDIHTLKRALAELERYDPTMTVGDAIYVIKDMLEDEGAAHAPDRFDEAVTWAIERLNRSAGPRASEHFYHICEGTDDRCGCSFQGE